MPIGFPAINDPRSTDLRGLQLVIRNIRERIVTAETALVAVQSQANQTTFNQSAIQGLQRQLAALAARVTVLETTILGGNDVTLRADQAIALDDPVVMVGDGLCAPVDVGDPERIYAVVGLATHVAGAGSNVIVRVAGDYQLSSGAFTAGRAIYCGIDGLTEDPSYGIVAIPVGVATGAQTMWIQPGYPRLQLPGPYDEFEQYLPITYGLFRDLVPVPADPTGVIGFTADPGVLDGFFMRADAAPALSNTLTTANADNFSLSTASDAGSTSQRGNITLTTGDNDTFTGCQVLLEGATPSGSGGVTATAGGAISATAESVLVTAGDWSFYLSPDAGIESSGSGDIYLTSGNGMTITSPSGVSFFGGNFQILTVGSGIDIAEGSDARMGLDTLSGGTVTVSTAAAATNSRIFLAAQNSGSISAPAALEVSARSDGVSFTISSADPADDRDVAWIIFGPA